MVKIDRPPSGRRKKGKERMKQHRDILAKSKIEQATDKPGFSGSKGFIARCFLAMRIDLSLARIRAEQSSRMDFAAVATARVG